MAPWGRGPGSSELTETVEKSFLPEERESVSMSVCECVRAHARMHAHDHLYKHGIRLERGQVGF